MVVSRAFFTDQLGAEVEDADEETYLLFAKTDVSAQNLGFVDPSARRLELTVAGKDLVINQSPSILASSRLGGTTGAVVWKVTPIFAEWIASPDNTLARAGAIRKASAVVELGCGISAIVGLVLSQVVGCSPLILTDQPYVAKLVEQNLQENLRLFSASSSSASSSAAAAGSRSRQQQQAVTSTRGFRGKSASISVSGTSTVTTNEGRVGFTPLDWETDEVSASLTGSSEVKSFDAVVACDCVYNEALIDPFVQTCVDICRLRTADSSSEQTESADDPAAASHLPCVCVVAQHLRTPDVFERWIGRFRREFHVWRMPDDHLPTGLQSSSSFVVHIGILR